jgi:hypothetical protein
MSVDLSTFTIQNKENMMQSSNFSELIIQEPLKNHFTNYVLNGLEHKMGMKEKAARALVALIGAAWGIPWMTPASAAADIFSDQTTRAAFEEIFAGGILITLGANGLWVMLQVGHQIGSKSSSEQQLVQREKMTYRISRIAFLLLLAFLACIAPVYAGTKYNSGWGQYLSIITFVCNMGYGYFGYDKFIQRAHEWYLLRWGKPELKRAANKKQIILTNIITAIENKTTLDNDFIPNLLNFDEAATHHLTNYGYTKKDLFQYIFSIIFSFLGSLVTIFLTKELLQNNIVDEPVFDYSAAVFCEIPTIVVNFISTRDVLGRLWGLVSNLYYQREADLISQLYFYTKFIMTIILFALSLTAPTAAAYVTYSTFEAAGTGAALQWMSVSAMVFVWGAFSNFTLTEIANELLSGHYRRTHPINDATSKTLRLMKFQRTVADANISFFSPQSHATLNGETAIEIETTTDAENPLLPINYIPE